ncbi:hypothetical protein U14_04759 [Candidatus Moduliflexus flocculans]|uniref:Uncharacterized protein n=1 Tax=Candidatus Moduliflexus flocculans TaxID=1499966 RepID=A0A0S6W671_9BACT|nr:hypothetical protein U14_04759 [Candidatus Moduliflexus flocculans]
MYTPSLHRRWHWLDVSEAFIEHHRKIAAALLILIVIGMLSTAADRFEMFRGLTVGRETEMSQIVAESVKPLTFLTDSAHASEYSQRVAHIMNHLNGLRAAGQIDRAYLAVYEYAPAENLSGLESHIFAVFEVKGEGIAPRFDNYQGMPREHWLQVQLENQTMNGMYWGAPQSYGKELYNERGTPIGYVGMERMDGERFFHDIEISQFQRTAAQIEQELLLPLNRLTQP